MSALQPVEAEEVVLDGEDVDSARRGVAVSVDTLVDALWGRSRPPARWGACARTCRRRVLGDGLEIGLLRRLAAGAALTVDEAAVAALGWAAGRLEGTP